MRGVRLLLVIVLSVAMVTSCADQPTTEFIPLADLAPVPMISDVPPATIHDPPELVSLATGAVDASGRPIRASCPTCHGIPGLAADFRESAAELGAPHSGIVFAHGENRCSSCHDPADRLALRTADGRSLPMTAAAELCRQCHGPQSRDYDHGSHGGMSGYWDTTRGARTRAHCIDCHDPHRPAWDPVVPAPPPRDPFPPARHDEEDAHD